ncbi:RNA polymerase sigma factor [Amorphus sp. 3PC139-8]|uniref:RNA polymerase sigma factor n=1 Tax=Amorphus sp. 3PC139-8 TaxID=2735676 RepID=UPI00345DAB7D
MSPHRSEDRSRERHALDTAIQAYYADLCSAVQRRGVDPALAPDVVHDLYVNLAASPEKITRVSSLRSFLLRAAANLGVDRLRRASFEARLFTILDQKAEEIASSPHAMETRLDAPKRLTALRDAIVVLPPQCKLVFVAHLIGGVGKDEIAQELGIRRRMVDRHLRKALLHCLDRMEAFE